MGKGAGRRPFIFTVRGKGLRNTAFCRGARLQSFPGRNCRCDCTPGLPPGESDPLSGRGLAMPRSVFCTARFINHGNHGTNTYTKRVYEAPAPDDGCRVLVDRLWPRGRTQGRSALRHLGQGHCAFGRTAQLVSCRSRGPLGGVSPSVYRRTACVAGRTGVRPRDRWSGHGDAALRLEKCGGEPCAHPAGVFAESLRRGYNRVIFVIFASPCPGSGLKTMTSAR